MPKEVLYFGYGANRDAEMISAILGKPKEELVGRVATLLGYKLAVQRLDQVPDATKEDAPENISPRQILKNNWDESFTSYVIQPDPSGKVSGTIWEITPEEYERIRDWELLDFGWYEDCVGEAIDVDGVTIPIVTEMIGPNQDFDHEVDGMNYETWLKPADEFMAIATKARLEYDDRQSN